MKRLINFLRGTVRVEVTGVFPERLLNLCGQARVAFWGVEWRDEQSLSMTVHRSFCLELAELAQKAQCEIKVGGKWGLPEFLVRFRKRYAFLLGLTAALCAVTLLSRFVWSIDVTGNERVPTSVILQTLRKIGVRPGIYGPALDRQQAAQEALLELNDLSWMGINLHGTRLEVIVREVISAPEGVDESGYYDIIAKIDGLIESVEALQGDALVKPGDVVARGDVLLSGEVTLEAPQYSEFPDRYYQTHARGAVKAQTWRTLRLAIPLQTQVKVLRGNVRKNWTLYLGDRAVPLWERQREGTWEKGRVIRAIPGRVGEMLPFRLEEERWQEYETESVEVDMAAARRMLEEQLHGQLLARIGEDAEVLEERFTAQVGSGVLEVSLLARCREEIGQPIMRSADRQDDAVPKGQVIFPHT